MSLIITDYSFSLLTTGKHGHGVELTLEGTCKEELEGPLSFEIHGQKFWSKFPVLVRNLSSMVLPFRLREWKWKTKPKLKHKETTFTITAVIGRYKLSHGAVNDNLRFLTENGDPEFLFEINKKGKGTVAMVRVTPSDLLKSIDGYGASIHVDNVVPPTSFDSVRNGFGSRSSISPLKFVRWLINPTLFTLSNWYLLRNPTAFVPVFPDIFARLGASVKDVLPIHPHDMVTAWKYGKMASAAEAATSPEQIKRILEEASKLAGRVVSLEDLTINIPKVIAELDKPHGIVSRLYGVFSLINLFWLFSIAGISVSVGPAVWALLSPVRKLLQKVITVLWKRVVKPTLEKLHSWGIFEIALWSACLAIVSDGWKQHSNHTDAGKLISLTGITLACLPALGYSTFLNGLSILNTIHPDTRVQLYATYIAATLAPLAVYRDSTLVGYFVVSALYVGLGLSGSAGNLCWAIGFHRKSALGLVNVLSALSVLTFSGLHVAGTQNRYLSPFRSPALVMGSITHYISSLIVANRFYDKKRYWKNQLRMIIPLLAGLGVSHVFNMPGLANTSIVFASLYATEKYIELHDELKWDGWVLVLLMSGLTYKVSLLAHQHPEFIAAIVA